MLNMTSRITRVFAPAAFWAAAVFTLWSTMAPAAPNVPGGDKVQHVAVFGLLALLLWAAYPRMSVGWRAACLLGFGATIEVLQGTLPFGRSAELFDLAADALGIGASAFLEVVARRLADDQST